MQLALTEPRRPGRRQVAVSGPSHRVFVDADRVSEAAAHEVHLVARRRGDRLMAHQRAETEARQDIASEYQSPFRPSTHRSAFHLWLPLPDPWRADAFAAALRARGVTVASEAFVVGNAPVPRAVRLCVTGPATRDELRGALAIVATTLEGSPEAGMGTI